MKRSYGKNYTIDTYKFWGTFGSMGITQDEFAQFAGISGSMLSKCLRGKQAWTDRVARAVAKTLKVPFDEIFKAVEEPSAIVCRAAKGPARGKKVIR